MRVQDSAFGVSSLGFRVKGFGCRVWGVVFRVQGSGFRISSFGLRVEGFRVSGVGCRVQAEPGANGVAPNNSLVREERASVLNLKRRTVNSRRPERARNEGSTGPKKT